MQAEAIKCHIGVQTEQDNSADGNGHEESPNNVCIELLSKMFSSYCEKELNLTVPIDFLTSAAIAMNRLASFNRSNVVYNLVKGIGTMRSDGSDSLFPVKRMPMGLLEYMSNFFAAENLQGVCSYFEQS